MPLVLLKGILLSLLGLERPPFLLTLSAGGLLERRLLVPEVSLARDDDAALRQQRGEGLELRCHLPRKQQAVPCRALTAARPRDMQLCCIEWGPD